MAELDTLAPVVQSTPQIPAELNLDTGAENHEEEGENGNLCSSGNEPRGRLEETGTGSKKENGIPEQGTLSSGENEITCDFCLEGKVRAVKSCLTCMVNYCEDHVRPHLENSKLYSHQLTEPIRDTDPHNCSAHQGQLVWFCCLEQQCICEECAQEDHRDHPTLSLEAVRREKQAELQQAQLDLDMKIKATENAIASLQANNKSILVLVSEVKAVAEKQFGELHAAVRKAQEDVFLFLEEKEQVALSQASGIKKHLENKYAELENNRHVLERMTNITSDILFLQECCKFKKNIEDSLFPSVHIGLKRKLSGIQKVIMDCTGLLIQLLQNYKGKLEEFAKEEEYEISTQMSADVPHKYWTSIPEPSSRVDFLKYAYPITFDPDTAHRYLRLQEDNHKVTNTSPWEHPYPDHPSRFEHWRQVLSKQSLYLNRYYFELELKGEGVYVGVTNKSIDRKGSESNSCISGNSFSWSIFWNGKEFSAWHNGSETPLGVGQFQRLGIYLNYVGSTLSFYGIEFDNMVLIHRFNCDFSEPVYLAYWLSKKDSSIQIMELSEKAEILLSFPVVSPASLAETTS
ncbi:tripartite motif-containing protein 16 [Dromiciops gliroides]|uniref:tripartite motif-containing protein 16 n=1 Tax=Dromiciops gliroides TaxID=33562 RepID=UPI001CC643E5|nr:tripartite motif-containing protein 16 [Dromiciops gliroides]